MSLDKLYLVPKIYKQLFEIPGRPVITNCGTATEKWSEFLDHQLKKVIQKEWFYVNDSGELIGKSTI